jgi:hypothetical protein
MERSSVSKRTVSYRPLIKPRLRNGAHSDGRRPGIAISDPGSEKVDRGFLHAAIIGVETTPPSMVVAGTSATTAREHRR